MDAPTHYIDICQKAIDVKKKYSLTDIQTLLYNHICRGDFKLRNGDGQQFYDPNNNGFGWDSDRNWVKKQFKSLISNGLVKFESIRDCGSKQYTSWYFYDPKYNIDELVTASCFVTTHKLALIKHYLNLPDGFDKHNKIYGDIEFKYKKNRGHDRNYSFKYKNEESIYAWDYDSKGIKQDLTWLNGQKTWETPLLYDNFSEMVHDIWSFLAHNGYVYLNEVEKYHTNRLS